MPRVQRGAGSAQRPPLNRIDRSMTKRQGLIIRHVPREGIAGFREPVEAAGYTLDRVDVEDPAFARLDLLIMMGGPMGVYEQDRYPWIACQMRRLASRLDSGKPTLGVCFGAQMIAAALGARVYPGHAKEVGFHALTYVDPGSPLRHLQGVPILHWHGDSFDLPPGVELLASSAAYRHQAFRRGPNILALQFHAEMGEDPRIDDWVREWPDALAEASVCPATIGRQHAMYGAKAVAAGRRVIGEWLDQLEH